MLRYHPQNWNLFDTTIIWKRRKSTKSSRRKSGLFEAYTQCQKYDVWVPKLLNRDPPARVLWEFSGNFLSSQANSGEILLEPFKTDSYRGKKQKINEKEGKMIRRECRNSLRRPHHRGWRTWTKTWLQHSPFSAKISVNQNLWPAIQSSVF